MSKKIRNNWIILLSGTTSSGKTSLAKALQKLLSTVRRPFLHIEADVFGMPHLPPQWNKQKEQKRFQKAFYRSSLMYYEEGYDLIIDGILPYGNSGELKDALKEFKNLNLCYVGVHADLNIIEKRVAARDNREIEFAKKQYKDLHDKQVYDLEVNTSNIDSEIAAKQVIMFLKSLDATL